MIFEGIILQGYLFAIQTLGTCFCGAAITAKEACVVVNQYASRLDLCIRKDTLKSLSSCDAALVRRGIDVGLPLNKHRRALGYI